MWISPLFELVAAVLTGLVFPVVVLWIKYKYNEHFKTNEKEEDPLDEEIGFSLQLNEQLETIREVISADRVWVAQFHNGKKFLHSVRDPSMKRISATHEVTKPGVSKEQHQFSDILVSFFADVLEKLINTEYVSCHHDEASTEPEMEVLLRQRGDESMYMFSMSNIDGELVGILGADFDKKQELTESEITFMKIKSSLLAGYIFYGTMEEEFEQTS